MSSCLIGNCLGRLWVAGLQTDVDLRGGGVQELKKAVDSITFPFARLQTESKLRQNMHIQQSMFLACVQRLY